MDINKAIVAIIDIEDHEAIVKTLVTIKKALVKNLKKVDFRIELNINKKKYYICNKIEY